MIVVAVWLTVGVEALVVVAVIARTWLRIRALWAAEQMTEEQAHERGVAQGIAIGAKLRRSVVGRVVGAALLLSLVGCLWEWRFALAGCVGALLLGVAVFVTEVGALAERGSAS